jgi:hypothetical protein
MVFHIGRREGPQQQDGARIGQQVDERRQRTRVAAQASGQLRSRAVVLHG